MNDMPQPKSDLLTAYSFYCFGEEISIKAVDSDDVIKPHPQAQKGVKKVLTNGFSCPRETARWESAARARSGEWRAAVVEERSGCLIKGVPKRRKKQKHEASAFFLGS